MVLEKVVERIQQPKIESLPTKYAFDFVHNQIQVRASDIREIRESLATGERINVARLFERKEPLPGLDNVSLCLDYSYPEQAESGVPRMMRFKYVMRNAEGNEEEAAAMFLEPAGPQEFILNHRLVNPSYSDQKLGMKLLQQVHDWVGQVAEENNLPVQITAYVGQAHVAKWLTKPELGYAVAANQQQLYDEVRKHPERFNINEEERGEKDRVFWLLRKEPTGQEAEDKVRLAFVKTIQPS